MILGSSKKVKGKDGLSYIIIKDTHANIWDNYIENNEENRDSVKRDNGSIMYFFTPNMFNESDDISYIALLKDKLVAHVQYTISMNMILCVSVHKEFRGKGLASILLAECIADIEKSSFNISVYSPEGSKYLHIPIVKQAILNGKRVYQYDTETGLELDITDKEY